MLREKFKQGDFVKAASEKRMGTRIIHVGPQGMIIAVRSDIINNRWQYLVKFQGIGNPIHMEEDELLSYSNSTITL